MCVGVEPMGLFSFVMPAAGQKDGVRRVVSLSPKLRCRAMFPSRLLPLDDLTDVEWSSTLDGVVVRMKQHIVVDPGPHREPVELDEHWRDVFSPGGPGHESRGRGLYPQLAVSPRETGAA